MGFTLLTLMFAFGAILKLTEECTEQNYTVISTSPPPSECQDLKNQVFKLQLQLEIQKTLNELKDNANQMKNIKQDILVDIEKLINNKLEKLQALNELKDNINQLKNIKQEIFSEIEKLDNKLRKFTPEIESIKGRLESLQKDKDPPSDCKDVQNQGKGTSGVYLIKPDPLKRSIRVWCDMTTRGGGWTYVINRFEGSQDFYLKWANYKFGFGNPSREYWIGLEPLHQITNNKPTELLVELVDWEDKRVYANYKNFEIGSEAEGFNLKNVGDYNGDAGDCLTSEATTAPKFTTKDKDQDVHATSNCANLYPGAWWHVVCFRCQLTGRYRYRYESNLTQSQIAQGIHWWEYKGHLYSLKEARMMIRPQDI